MRKWLLPLTAVLYFVGARAGYACSVGGAVTLWPPSGITLALLLLNPATAWPAIVAGAFAGSLASDLLSHYTPGLAVMAATANVFESWLAAVALRRFRVDPALTSVRSVLLTTVGAPIVSNAVSAIFGALVLVVGFHARPTAAWFTWWAGDGLGMLIVAPPIMSWTRMMAGRSRAVAHRAAEAVFLTAALAATALEVVGPAGGSARRPGAYAVFPLLFWAALRFGPVGASSATFIVAGVATVVASFSVGPFAAVGRTSAEATFQVYVFLAFASISALLAAAVVEERRTTATLLRRSEARYSDVLAAAHDPIFMSGADGRIEFANAATLATFGHDADDLIGQPIETLIAPAAREAFGAMWQRTAKNGDATPVPEAIVCGVRKDGTEIPLDVSIGRLNHGGRSEFTIILRDVSQKQAAETALRDLEERYRQTQRLELIGKLAGGIAHDFNNLLTIIQGNCDLLAGAIAPDTVAASDLGQIRAASERAAALTHQLLAFSRRRVLEPRKVRIHEVLGALKPMLSRLLGADIAIEVAPSSESPVMADVSQVEQVIINLAVNARDAMPEGGSLRFTLGDVQLTVDEARRLALQPGPHVRLDVTDTGSGMDKATMAQVFEPFFTTKPEGKGTGLGLATVHGIVKQSRGGIAVLSEPGRGTTFSIWLPLLNRDGGLL